MEKANTGSTASPILQISSLSVQFGGVRAVDNVSFAIRPGEILGLIGPNGAGKTTLFNCLTLIVKPSEGDILFAGKSLIQAKLRPHDLAAMGISRTFQSLALFPSMTVLENLRSGAHSMGRQGFMTHALGVKPAHREEARLTERCMEVLELLGLADIRNKPVAGFSYGVLKRVELARALVSKPKLLLVDEPAGGLSHAEVDDLASVLRRLRDDLGITLMLVEHHMKLVMGVSDEVVVLDAGRKIAQGTPAQVQSNPDVIRAYLGESEAA